MKHPINKIKKPKRFDCVSGTDGCDNTFDIFSRRTGLMVASAPFWYAGAQAKRTIKRLASVLEALADGDFNFDFHALLEESRKVAVIWSIDDILDARPDLTDDQAWDVLKLAQRKLHATSDLTLISREAADELFGSKANTDVRGIQT